MAVDEIEIQPSGPVQARLRPPSSKSITNRALICAALAEGTSEIQFPLESEDTTVMVDSLRALGIGVRTSPEGNFLVAGQSGRIPSREAALFIGNSGTSVRFLTAMVATANEGTYTLDGVERMRQRPIQDLVVALQALGANVDAPGGCPPVEINATGLMGGEVAVRGDVSSQFLSGLLMACPYAKEPSVVRVAGPLVSKPYVEMTLAVMEAFGIQVEFRDQAFFIAPACYQARAYRVEPDASAASYLWAAAAITGGTAQVLDLTRASLQGDVGFVDLLGRMGCDVQESTDGISVSRAAPLMGIDCHMGEISDTAQTLAAVALFAKGTTTIRGIAHNRHKETDRIGNLAIELRKFGAAVEEREDGLKIDPPAELLPAVVETYDDHRMAMSLSLAGLRVPGVHILNPGCTRKTYPNYFEDLAAISR